MIEALRVILTLMPHDSENLCAPRLSIRDLDSSCSPGKKSGDLGFGAGVAERGGRRVEI